MMQNFVINVMNKITAKALLARTILRSQCGENFVDSAIKILIAVVLGALLLAGLYMLFEDTLLFSSRYKHDRKCYA